MTHPAVTGLVRMRRIVIAVIVVGGMTAVSAAGATPASSANDTSPTVTSQVVTAAVASSCPAPARRLTLQAEAAQVVMASVDFQQASVAAHWVHDLDVGGIAFFGAPTSSVGTDVARIRAAAPGGLRPFTAVDEEGGRVQRLAAVLGRIPSARQMAPTMTTTAVRDLSRRHAAAMRRLGFTVDLAPDMDVTGSTSGVIGDRSFSADAATASRYAEAFAAGLADSGVMATGKHFPGHGHASGDSHVEAVTTPPLADLERNDLIPFRAAVSAGVPSIMIGHLTVPGLTHGLPASLSPDAVTGLLRQQFGYDGLVISDSLGMVSVTIFEPDLGSAAVRTLRAGVDVALLPEGADPAPVIDHIVAAVSSGALPRTDLDRAVRHVVAAKALDGDRALAWLLADAASKDFLGRPPSADETSCWISELASGLTSRATMMRDLSLSPVWVGRNVDALYHRALGRAPTASARSSWVDAIVTRHLSFTNFTASAYGCTEYFKRSGGTIDSWISALYRQFLGRTPDAAGLGYWRNAAAVQG
ncbi:MAG: hypothetical protein M3Z46_03920, partial [Actinomycetota bacterium]|nr:hypothetical protein [Actinomycetota bacterium]